nr:immunoglobulin light chain junction region [Macaca mulatta]
DYYCLIWHNNSWVF